jgi:peptide/nickel transport system permease protein
LFRKRKIQSTSSLSRDAWKRFRKNYLAMFFLAYLIVLALLAFFAYFYIPDKTAHANQQYLELAKMRPGSTVEMLKIPKKQEIPTTGIFEQLFYGKENPHRFLPIYDYSFVADSIRIERYTSFQPNLGEILSIHLSEILPDYSSASLLSEENVRMMQEEIKTNHIVTKRFILGTDRFGRDMLSRLMLGARVSLMVGFIAVFISIVIGISLGSIAAYFGGWVDDLIMWVINVVWSIPSLLLVIAISFALGKGFWQIFLAVGLTMWVEIARLVRGQVMSIKEKEFVEAAKALGFPSRRIIFKHILPNVMAAVIVVSAANFASAILIEAGLSFLGIGVQPPMPSWGTMIKEHYAYIILDYAYLAILPGLAIMSLVLAFMYIGNALRDALDVKTA